ncbi:sensor domain-containing diguanylate cyclase [Neptunomonas antarctica]|uniref:PAS domain S-box-containing protein/diguanylate cyclase (GGDEF) domain-containing protein n=1 Tax=Neptunomonas antarctica TaxID=619304 RepID=A0A1N7P1Q3_9GAMM|nr:sensor domain-containing diguanylate cyclase [Neptunomonas antarctica]SIT04512.1 PAS domain S-box-containing protein/diguanylate cyclase (GGDEF) domain-containing protein [Neptunomonas antarctica]
MLASLRDYIDNLLEAVCLVDEGGNFIYLSSGFPRILGYKVEELLGHTMIEFVHPDDRELTQTAAQNIMKDESTIEFENRYIHKDGKVVHLLWNAHWNTQDKIGVAVARDITIHKAQLSFLQNLAFYDKLTHLPNRSLFSDRLHQALARARREKGQFALLFIDLDKLKYVNDTAGHQTGDRLLFSTANCLSSCIRESDTVSRFGGDEFVVIFDRIKSVDGAMAIANKILNQLRTSVSVKTASGEQFVIQASIGVAVYPDHGKNEKNLLEVADKAMYIAKQRGGNSAQLASANLLIDNNLSNRKTQRK